MSSRCCLSSSPTTGDRWCSSWCLRGAGGLKLPPCTPRDVDIASGHARISKAWKKVEGGCQLGTTKTHKSVRTINMPRTVLEALIYRGEWVFTNSGRGKGYFSDGITRADPGPVRIHSFNPNVWALAVARTHANGLRAKPRTHDLWHTCASGLIAAARPFNRGAGGARP